VTDALKSLPIPAKARNVLVLDDTADSRIPPAVQCQDSDTTCCTSGQLDFDVYGGRSIENVANVQRLVALTAAIRHNGATGQPTPDR
jgi:hypothetical protein